MKGIMFRPDMIQATVERRKTNTRRADASLREINREPDEWLLGGWDNGHKAFVFYKEPTCSEKRIIKPRYHIGETVYIKEAWKIGHSFKGCAKLEDCAMVHYSNTSISRWWGDIIYNAAGVFLVSVAKAFDNPGYELSPMFMPEALARHFLLVEAVRAERLQEISIQDVLREGIPFTGEGNEIEALWEFIDLWDSINPKYPWESNAWVWAYQFRLES